MTPVKQPLWTPEALAAATCGALLGRWRPVGGIVNDTRELKSGDLFLALAGEARDGHAFVGAALRAGASGALASRIPDGLPEGAPLLLVPDVMAALDALGRAGRARAKDLTALAVTGSVGKTSVKDALAAIFSAQGATHASEKSFNNHWGAPITLARTPAGTRWGVYEAGMNHAGELGPISRLIRPHLAVVTTVEAAHLEHFGEVRFIAEAKAEIFEGLEPGGAAILNRDNPWFDLLAERARAAGARVVGFGTHRAAEARLISFRSGPDHVEAEAEIQGLRLSWRVGSPGRHQAMNSLAAIAAAALAGADPGKAAAALARWSPGAGRGARVRIFLRSGGAFALIDESYNANPASARAALDVLSSAALGPGGRRLAFFGDMLELGPAGPDLHAALAKEAADSADLVYTAGPLMRNLHEALPPERQGGWFADSTALASALAEGRAAVRAGDAAMVKGSKGSRMGPVVNALLALSLTTP
ncbi:UDP-N-acetylmuramoylalanyl-D-glutamyl-2,6-diaminopimelate--D-alanyl-D-alanine ligase [Neomegalonema sp.]|uniref:UDP-N-acetylmuramoylalanyl-D-glutamyl-2, 6-diaminopimelate--D-alanyl-D-alanine ligase n=1 Tax=Neomegalonema sp. TaxID=2039713 RepID=UPI00261D8289|nr:UDP-N-acetylmuramoylalanyl-D-glutamyl-2,6-diaminopimelate--D-alanyl-D-alanine ligase [Neomegalonema sp.]MDD2868954.1 UDP-N-acetylmuramoylalanyl-D-glutamyl-2,6-diaminopimelate--D-alanyl-D-alanine ligase [Neomegalonema sp.]